MATVSSHLLNGTDGTHAGGVRMVLNKLAEAGTGANASNAGKVLVFDSLTDNGGRLVETVAGSSVDVSASYELQVFTAEYWKRWTREKWQKQTQTGSDTPNSEFQNTANPGSNTCEELVFRFRMPEPDARYHIPFIFSQNNYSVWWSAPE